ncbi:MAG: hypothetical protein KF850_23235 [Labilithrix sp.]|nr:hypothetical protein [Labilithrix sp.]MBX3214967.1 hypothetical protein [Labilithrix sp.]
MEISEVARVQAHLATAESMLAARTTESFEPLQRLTRRLLREELSAYRARGCFPKNREHPGERTPHFIDADGTRCAMAHLMEIGGAEALVAEIAATNNNAYVAELAADARFLAWLDAAGLSVEEAATIQPSYTCLPPQDCLCQGNGEGVVTWEGTILARDAGQWRQDARVDVVHGETGAVTAGDVVEVHVVLEAGQRVLGTATTGGTARVEVVARIEADDRLGDRCLRDRDGMYSPGALGPITPAQAANLLVSPEGTCKAELAKLDPCWAVDTCESGSDEARCSGARADGGAPSASAEGVQAPAEGAEAPDAGCSTTAGAPVTSSAVLLAILGALAARRRRRVRA